MLVDHIPVLAANLVYNVGVTRSTEAAANEVFIAKLLIIFLLYLMAQKAFGMVACLRVRPRPRYTQLFQTIFET